MKEMNYEQFKEEVKVLNSLLLISDMKNQQTENSF